MEAGLYLQNQMILENCKEYLKLLNFLPQQEEIWDLVDSFKPDCVKTTQSFEVTKNVTKIKFEIFSFFKTSDLDSNIGEYLLKVPANYFILTVELLRNQLSSISLAISPCPYLNRTIRFMNNKVCKVIDYFIIPPIHKEKIFYYIDKELIYTAEYDSKRRNLHKCSFVEKIITPNCDGYYDVYYERDYVRNTCYSREYPRIEQELTHNQFEKKNKGVLKRIRKLGQMSEKSNS